MFQCNMLNQTPVLCSSAGAATACVLAIQRLDIILASPLPELATSAVLSADIHFKGSTALDPGTFYSVLGPHSGV